MVLNRSRWLIVVINLCSHVKTRNRQCHLYNTCIVVEDRKTGPPASHKCLRLWQCECIYERRPPSESGTGQCNKTGASFIVKNFLPSFFFFFCFAFSDFLWFSDRRRFYLSRRVTWWKNKIKKRRKETKVIRYLFRVRLGETATDATTVWKDDRVAAPDHHGPEWPTQHVTVLFSRIAKSTGEPSSSFRVQFNSELYLPVFRYNLVINAISFDDINQYKWNRSCTSLVTSLLIRFEDF